MINYLIETTVCWSLFYGFYVFFLQKETFFQLNRYYLVGTLLGGLVIPLLEITPGNELAQQFEQIVLLSEVVVNDKGSSTIALTMGSWGWTSVFALLYGLILLVMAVRLSKGLSQIYWLKRLGKQIPETNYTRIETTKPHAPFSFFHLLFMNAENSLSTTERNQIITHELAHIKGRHSVDVILMELMTIFLWFHPLIFLYKRSIRENHEYLADQAVLQVANRRQYSLLLVEQAIPGLRLANNFNHSLLKRRIKMMSTHKSNNLKLLKYLICLPLLGFALFVFSCKQDIVGEVPEKIIAENQLKKKMKQPTVKLEKLTDLNEKQPAKVEKSVTPITAQKVLKKINRDQVPPQEKNIKKEEVIGDELYTIVQEMPRFPGCEDGNMTNKARKKCAEQLMLEYIYQNIKYPHEARSLGIEGMIVISFVVDKSGNIINPEVIRGIDGGCDDEAMRIVKQMPQWIPGKQSGQATNVKFHLPIRFKLED